jgi:acylphosphatase
LQAQHVDVETLSEIEEFADRIVFAEVVTNDSYQDSLFVRADSIPLVILPVTAVDRHGHRSPASASATPRLDSIGVEESTIRRGVIVRGTVQGVGFRYSARQAARRLGLTGWVRNRADGAVELEAEGPAAAVDELLAWLSSGPPGASVESMDVVELGVPDAEAPAGAWFEIRS